jgi:hypothetical protein
MIKAGDKLVKLQDKQSGGYASFLEQDTLYAFDTSQIMKGLISLYLHTGKKKYKEAAVKAGDFLLMMQLDNGAFVPTYSRSRNEKVIRRSLYDIWTGPWSGLNCKLTEGMQSLYNLTGEERYQEALDRAGAFYEKSDYIECSHPLGYWLEGLYAAGKKQKVKDVLEEKVIPRICGNGYIAYTPELEYAYVSGVIQLGILLFKLGYVEEARKIRAYGRTVQEKDTCGGLFQYADGAGNLDHHVHTEVNSWGTKYFCELERLMLDED